MVWQGPSKYFQRPWFTICTEIRLGHLYPGGSIARLARTISIRWEFEKVKFQSSLVPWMAQPPQNGGRVWRCSLCFAIYLQHECLNGSLSTKGEHSSMVEDTPAAFEHGRRRRVMGIVLGMFLRVASIGGINWASSQQVQCLMIGRSYGARVWGSFLDLFRYASHQFSKKFKVNKFMLGLNVRIQLLLQGPRLLDQRKCLECGEPHYQCDCPVERTRAHVLARPTSTGDLGKAHRIHAAVNNHLVEP